MIKRYNIEVQWDCGEYDYWYAKEDEDGKLVNYVDHVVAMEEMEAKIAELERSLESADGEVSDLIQELRDVQREVEYYEAQSYNDQMSD